MAGREEPQFCELYGKYGCLEIVPVKPQALLLTKKLIAIDLVLRTT